MSDVLLQRLVAASHGRVPVDTLSCPEWGYETILFAARGTWSPALQAMTIHEIAADFGRCCACGCEAVEEPMFLSPQTVFQSAADFLLRPLPATVRQGGVVYACGTCGSDQVDFGLRVRRDPIAADWIVESIDTAGHYCLGCGSPDCDPVPRPMTEAEHGRARAELKRLATEHIERVRKLRKVLGICVGGAPMTPPESLRVLVEAAFPGASIEVEGRHGHWCITPPQPVEIAGMLVATVCCDNDARVCAHRVAITAATIVSVGLGRLSSSELVEQHLNSPTAHELLAARRRLGL